MSNAAPHKAVVGRPSLLPQLHGVLVLHKPKGPTSARCLSALKRLGQRKIGHAGTLDPMAEGVLLVLLGHATKISGHLMQDGGKVYQGELRLGQTTDTWDAEGRLTGESDWGHVSAEDVRDAVVAWRQVREQVVPPYSAAKHQGRPLYALARSGHELPEKTKSVEISHAETLAVSLPFVRFRVACSSGTYIRSLAHSLGIRLGCGAVLTALTREYSHPFALNEAHSLDAIERDPQSLPAWVLPVTRALPHWPSFTLDAAQEAKVRDGVALPTRDTPPVDGKRAVLLAPDGSALALAQVEAVRGCPSWTLIRGLWT